MERLKVARTRVTHPSNDEVDESNEEPELVPPKSSEKQWDEEFDAPLEPYRACTLETFPEHVEIVQVSRGVPVHPKAPTPKASKSRPKKPHCKSGKPLTSYALFCKANYHIVQRDNPQAHFQEMSKLIAAKWHGMTDEEKRPYRDWAQQDRIKCT